jgi:hypothetical protein
MSYLRLQQDTYDKLPVKDPKLVQADVCDLEPIYKYQIYKYQIYKAYVYPELHSKFGSQLF